MNIEKDVIRNLNAMGTNAHSLDGKERLKMFSKDALSLFRSVYPKVTAGAI